MKIYVHYDLNDLYQLTDIGVFQTEKDSKVATRICLPENDLDVIDLVKLLSQRLKQKFKLERELSLEKYIGYDFKLVNIEQQVLNKEDSVRSNLQDKEDLFLELCKKRKHTEKVTGHNEAIKLLLKQAEQAKEKKRYRALHFVAKDILALVPDGFDAAATKSHLFLAFIEIENKRYEKAQQYLTNISEDDLNLRRNKDKEYRCLLKTYLEYQAEVAFELGEFANAIEFNDKLLAWCKDKEIKKQALIRKAASLPHMSKEGKIEAIGILKSILEEESSGSESFSLASYELAILLWEAGEIGNAMHTSLTALVLDSTNKRLKRQVAIMIKEYPQLAEALVEMLGAGKGAHASFSFLALTLKEFSVIDQATRLMKLSVENSEMMPEYVLNYIHILELDQRCVNMLNELDIDNVHARYDDILKCIVEFCRKQGDFELRCQEFSVKCKQFESILQDVITGNHAKLLMKYGNLSITWTKGSEGFEYCRIRRDGLDTKESILVDSLTQLKGTYKPDEISTLSILFTAVKILFIKGLLHPIAAIINLLEPLRLIKDLHLTLARNEHAYYTLIVQVLCSFETFDLKEIADESNIYVFGDSHCIPLVWQKVYDGEMPKLIRPLLATGLKAWHLRDGSDFYPKYAFAKLARSLPKGAAVVFIFCEIDCREGIVRAYEEFKYNSIDEGMKCVVSIYVNVVQELVDKYQLRAYVHPVPPVLDVTRENVLKFNKILKEEVMTKAKGNMKWLEIEKFLLNEDISGIKDSYKLDGTHLHPCYFSLLKNTISNTADDNVAS